MEVGDEWCWVDLNRAEIRGVRAMRFCPTVRISRTRRGVSILKIQGSVPTIFGFLHFVFTSFPNLCGFCVNNPECSATGRAPLWIAANRMRARFGRGSREI